MLAAKTELRNAQQVKEYLLQHNLLHRDYLVVKELGFIYFPLQKKAKVPRAKIVNTKFTFPVKNKVLSISELLQDKLTPRELELLPHSQEVIGDILILEIPAGLRSRERVIAQAFLRSNQHLNTVVRKDEVHQGDYRLRKVQVLAGKNTKETIHTENGVKLKIHLEQTYYSARLANERLRLAKQVRRGEDVLVMFSGAAPYPLVMARNSLAKQVYGIEINPLAHHLAVENVSLNNLGKKIVLRQGDVRTTLPRWRKRFHRIVMPLPKTGEQFLPLALGKVKPGGMIHLYSFLAEDEIPVEKKRLCQYASTLGYTLRVLRAVPCGQFSPRVYRLCFDLKVRPAGKKRKKK